MESVPGEPIVSAPKAWTCIALNVLAATLVSRELWPLAHRAFPKDVFLSAGSPMHFMSQRCKLLLVCAVLHTTNCINFAAHYAIAHTYATYNALAHRMIHALAGQPMVVLASLATLQRCFALAILDGDSRARRLWWTKLVCVMLVAFNTGTAAYWAVEVHRDTLLSAAGRLDARFLASWAFLPATFAPLASMSVCIWSTFKLRRQTARRSPSSAGASTSGIRGKIKGRVRSMSMRNQVSKAQAVAASDSQSQSVAGGAASSSRAGTVSAATESAANANTSGQSPYPIKRSLNLLNYSITGVWMVFAVTALFPTQLLASTALSAHAFIMVYMSVIITLESSFEKLVKRHRKKRKPVAEEENDPGWGMGGGAMSMAEMALEDGLDATANGIVDVVKAVDTENPSPTVKASSEKQGVGVEHENPT